MPDAGTSANEGSQTEMSAEAGNRNKGCGLCQLGQIGQMIPVLPDFLIFQQKLEICDFKKCECCQNLNVGKIPP